MKKKVAINGFGRIGRAYFRLAHTSDAVEVVAINDLMSHETAAYLLQYDSAYGTFDAKVSHTDRGIVVDGREVPFLSVKNPTELPWQTMEVDVVIEATGVFASYEKSHAHIVAGAKHVIITAPVKDTPPDGVTGDMVLMGVNSERVKECVITSNASCTTNAVGIPLNILNEKIGVRSALLNTVHGYTATQQLVDGPGEKGNLRYGRAGAVNIIPSSTGAAIATTKVITDMEGSFDGIALRVPTIVGSMVDLTFVAEKNTSVEEVNAALENHKHPLFSVTREPLVSSDILGLPFVSIADLPMTRVVDNTLVKVLLWYDNEMGYTQSLIEHTKLCV